VPVAGIWNLLSSLFVKRLVSLVQSRVAFLGASLELGRSGLLCLGLLYGAITLPAVAQKASANQSLTQEFPDLSSKERSRIAAKEVKESSTDTAYQALMLAADKMFQDKRYIEALAEYQHARDLRPYNVYPKVRIQDLQALLGMQAEQAVTSPAPKLEVEVVAPQPAPLVAPEVSTPVMEAPAAQAEPVERARVPMPRYAPPEPTPKVPGAALKPGEERVFREGNALVTERAVAEGGHVVIYRRAQHNWGPAQYFRNGSPVQERLWQSIFGR
jgi:hypothetical protein